MAHAAFNWQDPFLLDQQLTEDERMVREAAQAYCQDKLLPRVTEAFRNSHTDAAIFREMGELGLLGPTIPAQYGGPGLNYVAYGLIAREVERVDSGYRSMMSVQSSLVMVPIFEFGTEAQRQKYLPKLATGEWIGCFGLTEPNHGSNPAGMETNFKDMGDHYLLNGAKMWISNAKWAKLFLVMAKIDGEKFSAFLVERDAPGVSISREEHKLGLKGSSTARLLLEDAEIPVENLLHEEGKGHQVAFNALKLGRFKLASSACFMCNRLPPKSLGPSPILARPLVARTTRSRFEPSALPITTSD